MFITAKNGFAVLVPDVEAELADVLDRTLNAAPKAALLFGSNVRLGVDDEWRGHCQQRRRRRRDDDDDDGDLSLPLLNVN